MVTGRPPPRRRWTGRFSSLNPASCIKIGALLSPNVAAHDAHRMSVSRRRLAMALSRQRAVPVASDGNVTNGLILLIASESMGAKDPHTQSEIACAGLGEDVVGYGLVFSGEMTQSSSNSSRAPFRAHVDDVVGVGQAVL